LASTLASTSTSTSSSAFARLTLTDDRGADSSSTFFTASAASDTLGHDHIDLSGVGDGIGDDGMTFLTSMNTSSSALSLDDDVFGGSMDEVM
jgi:hypothetical protein